MEAQPDASTAPAPAACRLKAGEIFSARFSMNGNAWNRKVKVQIFEEAARTAFNQEHSLCIFRKTAGICPWLSTTAIFLRAITSPTGISPGKHHGDTPSGIIGESTAESLRSSQIRLIAPLLPRMHGSGNVSWRCPKDRFLRHPTAKTVSTICARVTSDFQSLPAVCNRNCPRSGAAAAYRNRCLRRRLIKSRQMLKSAATIPVPAEVGRSIRNAACQLIKNGA